MKKITALLLVILCLFLSGCPIAPANNNIFSTGRGDLFVPLKYTMPLGNPDATEKIGFEILETDSYGRTLCRFDFDAYWNPFFAHGAAYCVIQSSTDSTTSFYEDFCCSGTSDAESGDEVIRQLKEINDWEKPLDEAKLTTLPYERFAPTGCYAIEKDYRTYKANALAMLGLDSGNGFLDWSCLNFVCRDCYGRTMVAVFWLGGPRHDRIDLVMMKDGAVLDGDASTHLIQNKDAPWEEIHEFKVENHWNEPLLDEEGT